MSVSFSWASFAIVLALASGLALLARSKAGIQGRSKYHGLRPIEWFLVAFLFPPVGIILFLHDVYKDRRHARNKAFPL